MVVAIVLALAIPGILGALQGYRLRGAAWQVAGDLRLARQQAVTSQKNYRVTFTNKNAVSNPNTYFIERNDGTIASPVWVQEPARLLSLTPGVQIDPASIGTATFDPKGVSNTAGTVKLLSVAGQYDISLDTTGRVSVTKK